jgi:hypothetical protein
MRPLEPNEEPASGFVPGEVMLQFSQVVPDEQALAIVEGYGLVWRQWLSYRLRIALVGTPVGQEQVWVDVLNADPDVVVAQLNHTGVEPRSAVP